MVSSLLSTVTTTKKSAVHRSRRSARQLALQILFQDEFQETNPLSLTEFWERQEASTEVQAFTIQIVEGVLAHQKDLDQLINTYAMEWSLTRMPVVDRNILRCALFELLWIPDVPAKVAINEALELAKRFADDESKRFVNGILDRIIQKEPRLEAKRIGMMTAIDPKSSDRAPSTTRNPENELIDD